MWTGTSSWRSWAVSCSACWRTRRRSTAGLTTGGTNGEAARRSGRRGGRGRAGCWRPARAWPPARCRRCRPPGRRRRHRARPASMRSIEDLARLERDLGGRAGHQQLRGHAGRCGIYNLLVHGERVERVPVHRACCRSSRACSIPAASISSLSSIAIGPGETAQPIHADDQLIPIPKPHPPTVCNSMWALTDFTEANGATRIIPGTHVARPLARLRRDVRHHPRRDGQGQRADLARQPVARRRRQPHRPAARRHRHELLRRLHPPAGEPAARHPPSMVARRSRRGCRSWAATASTTGSSATSTSETPADVGAGRRLARRSSGTRSDT